MSGKTPILVTAFADVFFHSQDGIYFLDTLEGKLNRVADSKSDLEKMLDSEEGKDHYFLAGFIERAHRENLILNPEECYDFRLHPIVGGEMNFENIEKRSFLVALHLRGQLHEQVRHLPVGTKISGFSVVNESTKKPWWKVW